MIGAAPTVEGAWLGVLESDFDRNETVRVDHRPVGLQGNHARRLGHLTRADIECAIVEIAFDNVTRNAAFGQRTGPVGAGVIRYKEFPIEVENRQNQSRLDHPNP